MAHRTGRAHYVVHRHVNIPGSFYSTEIAGSKLFGRGDVLRGADAAAYEAAVIAGEAPENACTAGATDPGGLPAATVPVSVAAIPVSASVTASTVTP
jgi:hypothetical protein